MCKKSFTELLREQGLGKGEDKGHGPGQVDKVDFSMPQWQGSFATAECLRHFRRRPDGDVAPVDLPLVEDVCKSVNLNGTKTAYKISMNLLFK